MRRLIRCGARRELNRQKQSIRRSVRSWWRDCHGDGGEQFQRSSVWSLLQHHIRGWHLLHRLVSVCIY
jgi:hypothetical protein